MAATYGITIPFSTNFGLDDASASEETLAKRRFTLKVVAASVVLVGIALAITFASFAGNRTVEDGSREPSEDQEESVIPDSFIQDALGTPLLRTPKLRDTKKDEQPGGQTVTEAKPLTFFGKLKSKRVAIPMIIVFSIIALSAAAFYYYAYYLAPRPEPTLEPAFKPVIESVIQPHVPEAPPQTADFLGTGYSLRQLCTIIGLYLLSLVIIVLLIGSCLMARSYNPLHIIRAFVCVVPITILWIIYQWFKLLYQLVPSFLTRAFTLGYSLFCWSFLRFMANASLLHVGDLGHGYFTDNANAVSHYVATLY